MRDFILILIVSFSSFAALGEENMVYCANCRSIQNFPQDFGNFAYNVSFGYDRIPELASYVSSGGLLHVINGAREIAIVDINSVTEVYRFNIFNFGVLELTIPTNQLEIIVQRKDGVQITYRVFAGSGILTFGSSESFSTNLVFNSNDDGDDADEDTGDVSAWQETYDYEDDRGSWNEWFEIEEL